MVKPPQLVCYTYSKGKKINLSYPLWCAVDDLNYPFYGDLSEDLIVSNLRLIIRESFIDSRQPMIAGYINPAHR